MRFFLFLFSFFFFICSEFCHTLKWKGLGFPLSWGKITSLWTSLLKMLLLHLIYFGKLCFHSGGSESKEFCNGRSLGEETDYPLQYSSLENSRNRGAWRFTVHGIAKSTHNWATNTFTFFQHIFIQSFMVVLGLRCCMGFSLVAVSRGLPCNCSTWTCCHGLPVVEHRC